MEQNDRLSNPNRRSSGPSGPRSAPRSDCRPAARVCRLLGGRPDAPTAQSTSATAGNTPISCEVPASGRRPRTARPVECPALPHGAARLDRLGARRTVDHVHRGGQRPDRGRGDSDRGDGDLQRPGPSDRHSDASWRRGDAHHIEPRGGHGHRHGFVRRYRRLRRQHHGHQIA